MGANRNSIEDETSGVIEYKVHGSFSSREGARSFPDTFMFSARELKDAGVPKRTINQALLAYHAELRDKRWGNSRRPRELFPAKLPPRPPAGSKLEAPRCAQEAPMIPQEAPENPQEAFKKLQGGPPRDPTRPQEPQNAQQRPRARSKRRHVRSRSSSSQEGT